MNKSRYLVVKGVAGLGNRLLSLLTAFLYAELCGRQLVIDWSDDSYSQDGSNVFPSFFDCPNTASIDELSDHATIAPPIWQGRLHDQARDLIPVGRSGYVYRPSTWNTFSIDPGELHYPQDIAVMFSFFDRIRNLRRHFTGEFSKYRNLPTDEILSSLWEQHLTLYPAIQDSVDKVVSSEFTDNMLGVHIRYSDKKSRVERILNKLARCKRRNPTQRIFCATDNRDILRQVQSIYPDVVTVASTFSEIDAPLHLDNSHPDRLKHGIEALVDMYLLAACKTVIWDESSFFACVARLIPNNHIENVHNVQFAAWLHPELRHRLWFLYIRMEEAFKILTNRFDKPL